MDRKGLVHAGRSAVISSYALHTEFCTPCVTCITALDAMNLPGGRGGPMSASSSGRCSSELPCFRPAVTASGGREGPTRAPGSPPGAAPLGGGLGGPNADLLFGPGRPGGLRCSSCTLPTEDGLSCWAPASRVKPSSLKITELLHHRYGTQCSAQVIIHKQHQAPSINRCLRDKIALSPAYQRKPAGMSEDHQGPWGPHLCAQSWVLRQPVQMDDGR